MLRWLPENVSTYGPDIDRLFYVIYYVTGATFFAVQITILVFLVLYRNHDDRRATYTHGNTSLEIACAELCGFGHSGMRGWLYVQTPEEYEAWARENKVGPLLTAPALGNSGSTRHERSHHPRRSAPRRRPSRGRLHPPVRLLHRPQDDRQAVPDPRAPGPHDGRPPRPPRPLGARLAGEPPDRRAGARPRAGADGQPAPPRRQHHAGRLQRLLHHARDHHDLLRGHADPGRVLRQLPDPAHDRRARHGLPCPQHAVVLGGRQLGRHHVRELLRRGRAGGGGLDLVRAALRGAGLHRRHLGAAPLVHQPDRARHLLAHGLDQLHHHHHQHARAGHDLVPPAARHLVALRHRDPPPPLAPGAHLRARHAPLRPHGRDPLLRA